MEYCKVNGCLNRVHDLDTTSCTFHAFDLNTIPAPNKTVNHSGNGSAGSNPLPQSMANKYPKYYKRVNGQTELDIYAVCNMFPVEDPSGAINHARKKLLVPGVRTGGKSLYQDIQEARDTLNRWLELNDDQAPKK